MHRQCVPGPLFTLLSGLGTRLAQLVPNYCINTYIPVYSIHVYYSILPGKFLLINAWLAKVVTTCIVNSGASRY